MLARLLHLWKIPTRSDLPHDPAGRLWLQLALIFWWTLFIATCGKILVKGTEPGTSKAVYCCFPKAAERWWDDRNLYAEYQNYDVFRYSPTFAVAATPFYLLSGKAGGILWTTLSMTALLAAMRSFTHWGFAQKYTATREGQILLLALALNVGGIWSQQSNAFLLAAILAGCACALQKRYWWSAFFLAIPMFLKIWPLIFVLLFLIRWPKQLLWRGIVVVIGLALVPFLTRPTYIVIAQYEEWYLALTGPLQDRWRGYRDAWTIWEELAPPVTASGYKILQVVTLALLHLYTAVMHNRLRSDRAFIVAILTMWSCWQLLFGPGTERLTYGLVGPAAAFAVWESRRLPRAYVLVSILWWGVMLFSLGSIEIELQPYFAYAKTLLPLSVVGLALWLLLYPYEAQSEQHA